MSNDVLNNVIDEIISRRASVRAFTVEVPDRAVIESILTAGMMGPYAKATVGDVDDYRRFILWPKGSDSLEAVIGLLRGKGQAMLEGALKGGTPEGAPFLQRLKVLADGKLPGLGTAPYLIAVAEMKGPPFVEQQSIAHCLENMWLKATALNLGFQLVSAVAMLGGEPRFWDLCGLPPDKYEVNACAIGVPMAQPEPRPAPDMKDAVIWMG